MKWQFPEGATPLDPQETAGLKLPDIPTRAELDLAEARAILQAELWLLGQVRGRPLDIEFLVKLHRNMFGSVWDWAGKFRMSEKNIGVSPWEIRPALVELVEDIKFQQASGVSPREIAATYHHRLLFIHPFPNGNGRWARRVTELHCESLAISPPSWIEQRGAALDEYRNRYIEALRLADQGSISKLQDLMFPVGNKVVRP